MRAEQLMTRDPACVTPSDTTRRAAALLAENDCGCLPVVENIGDRRVVGVVTDRDIAIRGVAHGMSPDIPVRNVMSTDLATVTGDADISQVERVMSDRQVRRVVVVDPDGICVGIVTQADLALAAKRGDGVEEREVARVVERISEPLPLGGGAAPLEGLENRP